MGMLDSRGPVPDDESEPHSNPPRRGSDRDWSTQRAVVMVVSRFLLRGRWVRCSGPFVLIVAAIAGHGRWAALGPAVAPESAASIGIDPGAIRTAPASAPSLA